MAAERRDIQPTGSPFVGEIDHDEIKHIEVNFNLISCILFRYFLCKIFNSAINYEIRYDFRSSERELLEQARHTIDYYKKL